MRPQMLKRHSDALAIAAATILFFAAVLTWLDKHLYSNEVFNNLSMALSYRPDDEALLRLKEGALAYCDRYAAPGDLAACRVYQTAITDHLYFAHPLTAVIGFQTRALPGDPNWLERLHWIALQPPLIGLLIALLLWIVLTLALPKQDRTAAVIFTLLLMFVGQSYQDAFTPIPDVLRNLNSWLAPATLALVPLACYAILSRRWHSHNYSRFAEFLETRLARRLPLIALALTAGSLALPPRLTPPLAALAILVLLASIAWFAKKSASVLPCMALSIVLGFLFAGVTSAPYWFTGRLGTSASFASLVYMATIGVAALRPQSRLIWLFPLIVIFHLPLAAMLGLATMLAEAVVSLRMRRLSHLLGAAALSFVLGFVGLTYGFESAAFSPNTAAPRVALELVLNSPARAPTAVSLAVLGLFALILLRENTGASLALARAGLLIFEGAAVAVISGIVQLHDPSFLNAPGYALFAKPAVYLTPALLAAGVLSILLVLRCIMNSNGEQWEAGTARARPLAILASILLLICVSKLELKLRNSFVPAPLNAYRYIILGQIHAKWCERLSGARFDDDTYYLSVQNPKNAPEIYWSALKARIRTEAGLFQPQKFKIVPTPNLDNNCD
jgi:hypothetical protein